MIFVNRLIQISVPFLWLGFVVGLSFIEAPLKFQASEITIQRGLGIGRLVFSALNKIELVLAFLLIFSMFFQSVKYWRFALLALILAILGLQTFWLLPFLDARAGLIIAGENPDPSSHHFIYVAFESVKVIGLFVFGVWTIKSFFGSEIQGRDND